jgi:hypothetical protein
MYQLGDVAVIRMRPLGEINGDRNVRIAKEDGIAEWKIIIPRDVVQNPLSKEITRLQSRKNDHRPSMPEANDQDRAASWLLRAQSLGYDTLSSDRSLEVYYRRFTLNTSDTISRIRHMAGVNVAERVLAMNQAH